MSVFFYKRPKAGVLHWYVKLGKVVGGGSTMEWEGEGRIWLFLKTGEKRKTKYLTNA